jgi:PPOX class probable FMN-dependent enzyme
MTFTDSIEALAAHYGTPGEAARIKVTPHLTRAYAAFVERSRFCVLSTVGPDGVDASPRGDEGAVLAIRDARTLLMPDWRGNERIDSLRNIVVDGRASLMDFVQGCNTVIRINGRARVSADAVLRAQFERAGRQPRTVIVFAIAEVYSQCARALMRAGLWSGENLSAGLPSVGDMLREITGGAFDGAAYDAQWLARAATTMW